MVSSVAVFIGVILLYLGMGVGLLWYLLAQDKGEREPISGLWIACGYGLLALAMAYFINNAAQPDGAWFSSTSLVSWPTSLRLALTIGLTEEVAKFLPLAFFLYWRPYFNEHTDGVIYFAISGLTFAVVEDIFFFLQFGNGSIVRLLFGGLFHAATCALVGFWLARSKVERKPLWTVAAALAGVVLIHGLYDFLLFRENTLFSVLALMLVVVMNVVLFITYKVAQELDESLGLRPKSGGARAETQAPLVPPVE